MKITSTKPISCHRLRYGELLAGFFILFLFLQSCQLSPKEARLPALVKVHDPEIELKVMVSDPDIVTPIGIAIDKFDRVYVLESHTHLAPKDYPGPDKDLIRVFVDQDGDGDFDANQVFASDIEAGMNMAFSPEGKLYVVTSKAVLAFIDHDEDGVSDAVETVIELSKPANVYPHAALLSIAFSEDGWMYIGRGNTSGLEWLAEGKSNTVSGYGDGGNVLRSKLDGSELEIFATGFWNPFDLKFDHDGKLLVADNDPDSRGPNRLVHAVKHGDYGYKSMFGGSGIHPYAAWDGELPGTLPYAVALGESPSGLIHTASTQLFDPYQNNMLCSIWEESQIVTISFEPSGASIKGKTKLLISGGKDFRPVAFAKDSKGNIYFTDWVLRQYPNHGKGRVWKLSRKNASLSGNQLVVSSTANNYAKPATNFQELLEMVKSDDPFLVHEAHIALGDIQYRDAVLCHLTHADPKIRLGMLLVLRHLQTDIKKELQNALRDQDPNIRNTALILAGTRQYGTLYQDLDRVLYAGEVTDVLFATYIETLKLLEPEFITAFAERAEANSNKLKRQLPKGFFKSLLDQPQLANPIKGHAIRYLEDVASHKNMLLSMLTQIKEPLLQREIIHTLASLRDADLNTLFLEAAFDTSIDTEIRADALAALARQPNPNWSGVIPLLDAKELNVRIEAARFLRNYVKEEAVNFDFTAKLGLQHISPALTQQLRLGINGKITGRPSIHEQKEWEQLLSGSGDPNRGKRVFYASSSQCASCHAFNGRGGDLGPDLSLVAKSKSTSQLIRAIIDPSAEMSPEWQGWYISLKDGSHHEGRQIDINDDHIELLTQSGFQKWDKSVIKDYGMVSSSLMPEGLEKNLTDQDLKDLLAFLKEGIANR
jgi:putative membrane-bound dehydrogenase-like protein